MIPCNVSVVRRQLFSVSVYVYVCGAPRERRMSLNHLGLANQGRLACVGPVNRALKWPVINHWPETSANNFKTWEHTHSFSDCPLSTQPYETQQHTRKILNTDRSTVTNKYQLLQTRTHSEKQHDITIVHSLANMYSIEIQ